MVIEDKDMVIEYCLEVLRDELAVSTTLRESITIIRDRRTGKITLAYGLGHVIEQENEEFVWTWSAGDYDEFGHSEDFESHMEWLDDLISDERAKLSLEFQETE